MSQVDTSYEQKVHKIDRDDIALAWGRTGESEVNTSCCYVNAATCPDCGAGMVRLGSCFNCPLCGWGSCG